MGKTAFATWKDRIAPVFDVARTVHLVQIEAGRIIQQSQTSVAGQIPNQKALRLAELEVGTLICGAISRPLQRMVAAYGIEVIPFVAGDLDEVIQAWLCGRLVGSAAFAMPGCPKGAGHVFQNNRAGHEAGQRKEKAVKGNGQGKRGAAQGRGGGQGRKGQGGQGCGRNAGSNSSAGAAGAQAICVCPQCGHQEPHKRGTPCMQIKCAKCGSTMVR